MRFTPDTHALIVGLSTKMLLERVLIRILTNDKQFGESSESLYEAFTLSIPEKLEEARRDLCLSLIEDEDQRPDDDTKRTILIEAFQKRFPEDLELAQETYFFCKQLTESDYDSLAENLKEKEEAV